MPALLQNLRQLSNSPGRISELDTNATRYVCWSVAMRMTSPLLVLQEARKVISIGFVALDSQVASNYIPRFP